MGSFIGKMFFLSRHVFFVLCEEASTLIDLFHLKVDLIQINSSRFESSRFELNWINSNWIDLTIRILPIPSWQGVFLWHSDISKSNKCWLVVTWIQEQDPSMFYVLWYFFFETKERVTSHTGFQHFSYLYLERWPTWWLLLDMQSMVHMHT